MTYCFKLIAEHENVLRNTDSIKADDLSTRNIFSYCIIVLDDYVYFGVESTALDFI